MDRGFSGMRMNRRDLKDLTRMGRKMVNRLGTTKMVQ